MTTATTTRLSPVRSAGLLLHPTSLPGPYGIGDLGPAAYAWVEALVRAGQSWWQVLPLGPTGYGDSPYQSFSAFAGNANLLSPDMLEREGLVRRADLGALDFRPGGIDYGAVIPFKANLVALAWENFRAGKAPTLRPLFESFVEEQKSWLDEFTLFMALKDAHGGASWAEWSRDLRLRQPAALLQARAALAEKTGPYQFGQFLFFRQWEELKRYAHERGVRLIGDLPIFVSDDSADVWVHPDQFLLDKERRPTVVAGVPPDYFSATGQLWGNPLYDWAAMKRDAYSWWLARLKATLRQVDVVRMDHFRGFEAAWHVPAGLPTAQIGQWTKGAGADLFTSLGAALGGLPLIAEDLGVITPEVDALRLQFRLPGMRILQFAFGGAAEDRFLPHNYEPNTVAYTCTHDNDTTVGWYATLTPKEQAFFHRYAPEAKRDPALTLVRLAWASVADFALAPLQDVLGLGTEARMNRPGVPSGNWGWRFTAEQLQPEVLDRLGEITETYGRARKGAAGWVS